MLMFEQVAGYFRRELFSILLTLVGCWVCASPENERAGIGRRVAWVVSCGCLAVFPWLSTEMENNITLVYVSPRWASQVLTFYKAAAVVLR